jgi:hypothetical protein
VQDLIRISNIIEWRASGSDYAADPDDCILLQHPAVKIDPRDINLLKSALTMFPSHAVVIARIFLQDRTECLLNGGYWRDDNDLLWKQLLLGEVVSVSDAPVVEEACHTAIGAALMSSETAKRIGYFDHRFATALRDEDWLLRAKRLGIRCVVARNARVVASPFQYPARLGDDYSVIRDGLLLARKHEALWPVYFGRVLLRLVLEVWRPFDIGFSHQPGVGAFKSLAWALASYSRGLKRRMYCAESVAMIAAIRDFIMGNYHS